MLQDPKFEIELRDALILTGIFFLFGLALGLVF